MPSQKLKLGSFSRIPNANNDPPISVSTDSSNIKKGEHYVPSLVPHGSNRGPLTILGLVTSIVHRPQRRLAQLDKSFSADGNSLKVATLAVALDKS